MSADKPFFDRVIQAGKDIWDSTDSNKSKKGDLNTFISNIKKKGLARNNAFVVTVHAPRCLTIAGNARYSDLAAKDKIVEYLGIVCNTASLPGIAYDTVPVSISGRDKIEVPYLATYDPVSLSFYVDSEMRLKFFFDNWMDAIRLHSTKGFEFFDNYVTNIDIDIIDPGKGKIYSVRLLNAYPKQVNAVNLSWNDKEVMSLQVTFSYGSYITTSINAKELNKDTSIFDTLFGGYGWYQGGKEVIEKIGDVLSTVDEYVGRFERLKGKAQGYRDQFKGISGIFKSKQDRIKDLGKWL